MLESVRVPPEMTGLFEAAERVVSRFFRDRTDDPSRGTIEIFGERYVLVRAASLSVELFTLVEELYGPGHEAEADEFARNLLFDLAHAIGRSDAQNFHARMGLVDPVARLSAGPVHFAHAGWASVDISPESHVEAGEGFYLLYDHPYSFEAEAWLRAGKRRPFPVCVMNAGYSSGWCEESFGVKLVAFEVLCRARGDEACRFVMAPPSRIEEHVERFFASRPTVPHLKRQAIPDFFARKRAEHEIAILYERLKELDRVKSALFANVSHELRTPLALILGIAERIGATANLDDDRRHDLDVLARNARLLLQHVEDLLAVARLEAAKVEMSWRVADLARVVATTASFFEAVAVERGVRYVVDAPPSVRAEVDPGKVQRILANLLSNAFKATPVGGEVRCALEIVDGHARIVVDDSGPGIPAERRDQVFERFAMLDRGDGWPLGGTGLGLSIAKELTELHGGTIAIADAPVGGARFVVELPLAAPPGAVIETTEAVEARDDSARLSAQTLREPLPPASPKASTTATTTRGPSAHAPGRALVLVVEDNVELNRFLVASLEQEYEVVQAFDGEDGLDKALALRPDVVVTDVMMPKMTGDALVRAARARTELDAIPILVLTARADDELRVELLRSGAQDFVQKPFSLAELRARIANLVVAKRTREALVSQLATDGVSRPRTAPADASDLTQLAEESTRRQRELRSALDALGVAREQAERASAAKSNLLALVSHEFLTPLATQRLCLDLVARDKAGALSPMQEANLRKIGAATTRLHALVESLLELARIQSGRLAVRVEPFDLAALAADVVDELRPQADARGLALVIDAPADLPPMRSDTRLVRLVLGNLVGNAIKYTDRGKVEIRLGAPHDAQFRIEVVDTGRGIPESKLGVVFEPFTQLEPVREKHAPGVGLGLALVGELVSSLGGTIDLQSKVGVGTHVTVKLPG